jgi:uncharacterized protein
VELPDPPTALVQQYRQLVADLETAMAEAGQGLSLRCGPGCASCCIAFAVLPLEAALLRTAIAALPSAGPDRPPPAEAGAAPCPLLSNGLCRVYAARPLICRSQGLALAYVDEEAERIEVSACPDNFPDDYVFQTETLLFLDPFNARLAALNLEYCRSRGIPAQQRIAIRALVCSEGQG